MKVRRGASRFGGLAVGSSRRGSPSTLLLGRGGAKIRPRPSWARFSVAVCGLLWMVGVFYFGMKLTNTSPAGLKNQISNGANNVAHGQGGDSGNRGGNLVVDLKDSDSAGGLRGKSNADVDDGIKGCSWIKSLLENPIPVKGAKPLPKSGKRNTDGNVFWLKSPVLHSVHPDFPDKEVMVLKYNIYNKDPSWTQHTDKYTNTVDTLSKHRNLKFLPRLYAHCKDIDGFHHIAVEYIGKHMNELPRPKGLRDCANRAIAVLSMFAELDDNKLCMMDMKPGQWMVRNNGEFVIQDVDDIVTSPTRVVYDDQAEGMMGRFQNMNGMRYDDAHRAWSLDVFPRKTYNIRYVSIALEIILGDLGFHWSSSTCASEPNNRISYRSFSSCRKKVAAWGASSGDAWPTPGQLVAALKSCRDRGEFEKDERPNRAWHRLPEPDRDAYQLPTACVRPYDNKKSGGNKFTKCKHSCCRNKGSQNCYYDAPASNCAE